MQIRNLSSCLRDGVVSFGIDDETGKAREREKGRKVNQCKPRVETAIR